MNPNELDREFLAYWLVTSLPSFHTFLSWAEMARWVVESEDNFDMVVFGFSRDLRIAHITPDEIFYLSP